MDDYIGIFCTRGISSNKDANLLSEAYLIKIPQYNRIHLDALFCLNEFPAAGPLWQIYAIHHYAMRFY